MTSRLYTSSKILDERAISRDSVAKQERRRPHTILEWFREHLGARKRRGKRKEGRRWKRNEVCLMTHPLPFLLRPFSRRSDVLLQSSKVPTNFILSSPPFFSLLLSTQSRLRTLEYCSEEVMSQAEISPHSSWFLDDQNGKEAVRNEESDAFRHPRDNRIAQWQQWLPDWLYASIGEA